MPEKQWEYRDGFLDRTEADALYRRMLSIGWIASSEGPDAFKLPYGFSYQMGGGIQNGEVAAIPSFLQSLADRVSKHVGMPVNYVQCHNFGGQTPVRPHFDPTEMVVPMLVLGHERVFRVGGIVKTGGIVRQTWIQIATDPASHIPEDEILLCHGSLLTFNGGKTIHSMFLAAQDARFNPNGFETRISILFRWTTPAMREHGPGKSAKAAGTLQQYAAAKNEYRDRIRWVQPKERETAA